MTAAPDTRVPVTVVTGYLGAGKTTLINRLIAASPGRRIAVIVNEFGEIGIDGALVESGTEELIELNSGCVCCVVRGDLIRALRDLARRSPGFDHLLIETTGLANPAPVIQSFLSDQMLSALCRLDSVIAVADGRNLPAQIRASADAAEQIALADQVVLSKSKDAAPGIEATVRAINPLARFRTDAQAGADLLAALSFDPERVARRLEALPAGEPGRAHITRDGIASLSLCENGPVDPARLERWLSDLVIREGADLLRVKGILATPDGGRLVVQGVHMMLEAAETGPWPEARPRQSRLVFIGRNLDTMGLRRGFAACAPEPA